LFYIINNKAEIEGEKENEKKGRVNEEHKDAKDY